MEKSNLSIFVGGIPLSIDEQQLTEYFSVFGDIRDCNIQRHKKLKLSRGYGFIRFVYKKDAEACIDCKNHVILGRNISCSMAKSKSEALNDVFKNQYNKLFIGGVSTEISEEI